MNVFSKRYARRDFFEGPRSFSDSAMELLILYSWPGNVRELANEIRKIIPLMNQMPTLLQSCYHQKLGGSKADLMSRRVIPEFERNQA